MKFARIVFLIAGVYGLLVTMPLYFMERRIAEQHPPAVTHPEYFYGFVGLCLAWQVMFLLIGSDPARFRPAMPVAVLEKATFAAAVAVLYLQDRVGIDSVVFGGIDAVLGVLFVVAFIRSRR